MKERPILFSGPMVNAILAGRKTQTRRIVKPQPVDCGDIKHLVDEYFSRQVTGDGMREDFKCPYGKIGDRIWVRETWRPSRQPQNGGLSVMGIKFAADDSIIPDQRADKLWTMARANSWRPSIHMPRWASRIALEITGVRVERLNDITESDSEAEGVSPHVEQKWWQGYYKNDPLCHTCLPAKPDGSAPDSLIEVKPYRDLSHMNRTAKREYELLWNRINGPDSWQQNPWVWVIEFKRITP